MSSTQLHMIWPEGRAAPDAALAEGYVLRPYQDSDLASYLALMHGAGFVTFTQDMVAEFRQKALPNGVFVVVHEETGPIVATAMAVHRPRALYVSGGELGWVAGDVAHGGKGLGMAVCAAVVRRFLGAGYHQIYLQTDDNRLAAIKVYLKLGFIPCLYAWDMERRWETVCETLKWPFTPKEWKTVPEAVFVKEPPEERQDDDRMDRYGRRYKWLPSRPHKAFSSKGDVDTFGDESLYQPSKLGRARVEPREVVAGDASPLSLSYIAGKEGLPEGARVACVMRGQNPLGPCPRELSVRGPSGCDVRSAGWGFFIEKGSLKEGDEVVLESAAFRWTPLAGRREFKVVLNYGEDRPEQRLPEPVVVTIKPREFKRLEVTIPATRLGEARVPVHVTSRDEFDNRAALDGTLKVGSGKEMQEVVLRDGIGNGDVDAGPDEVIRVRVISDELKTETESNPSVRSEDLQLFVGDLHCHDFMSEAEGYPDNVYRWAIEDRNLDFVTVAPQAHGYLDNETWTVAKYMNERFLEEGKFVTLLGFEWQHTGYGDKVVHYLGGDQPFLPVDDKRYNSAGKLYAALRSSDALVVSHHPSYPAGSWCSSTDFDEVETDVERLVELWSMHGSSEGYDQGDRPMTNADPERQVMAALRKGVRIGFVAGSDTHSGRPGGSAKEPRPHWGGLAAVWARNLTRRSLFEALHARHTYALTRARIVLKMTVNDALMGSDIPEADDVAIKIDVWAPGTIHKVELLKNTSLLKEYQISKDECHLELEDKTDGPAFYHCRVTLEDGNLAVCSPVWVG